MLVERGSQCSILAVDGISYGGGATAAIAVLANGATGATGHGITLSGSLQDIPINSNSSRWISAFSADINTSANWLELRFELPNDWGACCGFDLSRVQLEGGAGRTRFEERPLATEKELCERYYSIYDVAMGGFGSNGLTLAVRENAKVEPYNPGNTLVSSLVLLEVRLEQWFYPLITQLILGVCRCKCRW